ncbi:demethylmenaquinone methyltransferase [Spelaeicoccus albus]|nr:demethylmenaquinone methyltransferase [Spelaeicoccus albus]
MNRAHLDKQPSEVAAMFDRVAARYDVTNDVASLGQARLWRTQVVRAVHAVRGESVLDLAAGTGTSSEPFADLGARVVAGDISEGMLAEGRRRRPDIDFRYADAMDLPFGDDTFDAVTISFGLRNVHDTIRALSEMRRVTKPGGRIVVCEFSTPTFAPFRRVYFEYLMRALPSVARTVSSNPDAYVYLAESIRAWPDQDGLAALMSDAGWARVRYRNLTGGIVALHRAVKPDAAKPDAAARDEDRRSGSAAGAE